MLRLTTDLEGHGREKAVICEMGTESQADDAGVALTPGHTLPDRLHAHSANEASTGLCCCQTLVDPILMFRTQSQSP